MAFWETKLPGWGTGLELPGASDKGGVAVQGKPERDFWHSINAGRATQQTERRP